MFTGFFDTSVELGYKTGWLVIGTIGVNVAVNMIIAIFVSIKGLVRLGKIGIMLIRYKFTQKVIKITQSSRTTNIE